MFVFLLTLASLLNCLGFGIENSNNMNSRRLIFGNNSAARIIMLKVKYLGF